MTLALAAIAYSYSRFSGLKASIITDVVQLGIILIGGALLVVLSLRMTGGFDTVRAGLGAVSGEYTSLTSSAGIEVLLGYGLPMAVGLISGPFGDQCFWQRAFAIRRDRIGRSFFAGALFVCARSDLHGNGGLPCRRLRLCVQRHRHGQL